MDVGEGGNEICEIAEKSARTGWRLVDEGEGILELGDGARPKEGW